MTILMMILILMRFSGHVLVKKTCYIYRTRTVDAQLRVELTHVVRKLVLLLQLLLFLLIILLAYRPFSEAGNSL